jgi:hypothetical protein
VGRAGLGAVPRVVRLSGTVSLGRVARQEVERVGGKGVSERALDEADAC